MIEFIPYFGAIITLIFSAGFAYAVGGGFDKDKKTEVKSKTSYNEKAHDN